MIISHRHRFIFIKTQKTAGTSIEVALSKVIGDDAVVTPVYPPVEGHHPRNFELPGDPALDRRWRARHRRQQLSRRLQGRPVAAQPTAYWNHMRLREVLRVAGEERLAGYTTFAFERDPFDKVRSAYRWAIKDDSSPPSLSEWLLSRHPAGRADYLTAESLPVDFDRYSLDGAIVGVDYVGRYEQLAGDLATIVETVGINPASIELPRTKTTAAQGDESGPVLGQKDIELIAQAFSREIACFGFVPPPG